jgi:hypothetical protein
MKLMTVPANRGVQWVRSGFRVFFAKPASFAALFAAFLFGALLLLLLPGIGGLLMLAALPLVSQGFMLATQRAAAGQSPRPDVFAAPLRGHRDQSIAMLKLGLMYAVATVFVMWASDVLDAGKFEALQKAMLGSAAVSEQNAAPGTVFDSTPDPTAAPPAAPAGATPNPLPATLPSGGAANMAHIESLLADPQLLVGMLVRIGLISLLSVPFWHAPALVYWHKQSPAQALFSSTLACWRNRGAFTLYGLTWTALLLAFSVLVTTVFALLGVPQLAPLAAMSAVLLLSTVFYASLYFTFADCFAPDDATVTSTAATPGSAP